MPRGDSRDRGVYRKYQGIQRTDGSSGPDGKHEHCRYFVLDLDHQSAHCIAALVAFADSCVSEHPRLAKDLRKLARAGKDDARSKEN